MGNAPSKTNEDVATVTIPTPTQSKEASPANVLESTEPRTLVLTLSHASNLVVADIRTSDPYVEFRVGNKTLTSTCVASTVRPVWGLEKFKFQLTEADMHTQELSVNVYDHDIGKKDDLIGFAVLPLVMFESNKARQEIECPLVIPDKYSGQLVKSTLTGFVEVIDSWSTTAVETRVEVQQFEWLSQTWKPRETEVDAIDPVLVQKMINDPQWAVTLHAKTEDATDPNGWMYAYSWDGPWYKTLFSTASCRKREWARCPHP